MQCEIVRKFFDLLSVIHAQNRLPTAYAGEQPLSNGELELLIRISEHPELNVSDLSRKTGVTKSAVTQMSAKLLEKELIEKYSLAQNRKEKYFRLSPGGQAVLDAHREAHKAASQEMQAYLCALDCGEKQTILTFMGKLEEYMPLCALPCRCETCCTSLAEP